MCIRDRQGAERGVAADAVIVTVGADHAAVDADVHRVGGGHRLQLGGGKVRLGNAVLVVKTLHHVDLHTVAVVQMCIRDRVWALDKPETLDITADVPADVARVTGFTAMSQEEIAAYWQAMGFAMSAADLAFCRDYFRDEEKRDPSLTELKVIDTYWSDHCRHTTFLTLSLIHISSSGVVKASRASLTSRASSSLSSSPALRIFPSK